MEDKYLYKMAAQFAEAHFLKDAAVFTEAPWNKAAERYMYSLVLFAREALARQWIRVDERTPADGQTVLIREYFRSASNGRFITRVKEFTYFDRYGFFCVPSFTRPCCRITHWMPIPEP